MLAQGGHIENLENYQNLVQAVVLKATFKFNLPDFGLTTNDLVQEGNLALIKAAKTFNQNDGRAKFETYASVCIKNRIIDILRTYTARGGSPSPQQLFDDMVSDKDYLDLALKRDTLEKALKTLPEIERAIFNSYFQGHSYAEIAKIFEITPKKIDNTIQKVKSLVRG